MPTLPYASNLAYIQDEMRRLDLLIRLRLPQEEPPNTLLDQLKGLVLSPAEINKLLSANILDDAVDDTGKSSEENLSDLDGQLDALDREIEQRRSLSSGEKVYLSLPHLAELFHLTTFEEKCLILCLAPEIDRKYEKLFAYVQDDLTCRKPTVDLVLKLFCRTAEERLAARLVFDPASTLLTYRLIQIGGQAQIDASPLLSRTIKLDDRIVNFLLGFSQLDNKIQAISTLETGRSEIHDATADEDLLKQTAAVIRAHVGGNQSANNNLVFYLHGRGETEALLFVKAVCQSLGLKLIVVDLSKVTGSSMGFDDTMQRLGRETVLQPGALCLLSFDSLQAPDNKLQSELKSVAEMTCSYSRLTFLIGTKPWHSEDLFSQHVFIDLPFASPDERTGIKIWERELNKSGQAVEGAYAGAFASKFRFTSGQVKSVLRNARNLAMMRQPNEIQITATDLHAASRAQANPKLGSLAKKIDARFSWDDIVLPADQVMQLTEICGQAKHRHIVFGDWCFDRKLSLGRGLNALFSGPPGTGKTMAAEVIALELQLDLYKIDLSQVVSKYIGETEKNLNNVFQEAQTSSAILFFDEADALFGKRSEVKDAHDRYANIEVGYLLQRMEEYDGIAILSTNLRQNLDEAFIRRMQFIIEFPFPDEEYRRRIWRCVFPAEAPLGEDVDFALLGREVKLAGGNIKNIGLAAAFFAAADGKVIRMPHLIRAAQREFQKLGRTWNDSAWNVQGRYVS